MTTDVYQKAISYLVENPDEISRAWFQADNHKAGCLFNFCTPSREPVYKSKQYGCLTQIKGIGAKTFDPEFTQRILQDTKMPESSDDIEATPECLEVFRSYQIEMDEMWNREMPEDKFA